MALVFQEASTPEVVGPIAAGHYHYFDHALIVDGLVVFDALAIDASNDWFEYALDENGYDFYQIGATYQGSGKTLSTFAWPVGTRPAGQIICKPGTNNGGSAVVDTGVLCATLYSGVNQTTPYIAWQSKIDSAGSPVSLSMSAPAGSIVSGRFAAVGKTSITPGAGQTMRWQKFDPAYAVMASDQPGGAVSHSYTYAAPAVQTLLGAFAIQPLSYPIPFSPLKNFIIQPA
jgi:hypothetical protein